MITTDEYRKILSDYSSPEELIRKRIEFLTAFCRNLAKNEIENYVKKNNTKK